MTQYRIYCYAEGKGIHSSKVSGPGTMVLDQGCVEITVSARQDWAILTGAVVFAAAAGGIAFLCGGMAAARYVAVVSLFVGVGLMDWLYPKKRRVFRVTDLSHDLDLRESPGTFWMRVQPRRWIAVSADDRGDRKKMEEDLKALLQEGDTSPDLPLPGSPIS